MDVVKQFRNEKTHSIILIEEWHSHGWQQIN